MSTQLKKCPSCQADNLGNENFCRSCGMNMAEPIPNQQSYQNQQMQAPLMIVGVIGLIEGIIYLTKSDEEFVQTYIVNKKPWF